MHEITNNEFVHFIVDLLLKDNFSLNKESFSPREDISLSLGMKFFPMGRHAQCFLKDEISPKMTSS
jgi:hypothetical protein